MRRLSLSIIAAVSTVALTQIAPAADLPKGPVYQAPVVVAPSWGGFYLGGDVGWYGERQSGTNTPLPAGFGVPPIIGAGLAGGGFTSTNHNFNSDLFGGGIYAGYNWQFGDWLAGVEADISFFNRDKSDTQLFQDTCCAPLVPPPTMTLSASNDWVATARGRFGGVVGNWLFYGTGGAAWTRISYAANLTPDGFAFPAGSSASTSFSKTETGFVVGGGVEYMLPSSASHWVARLEYLYYRFPGASGNAPVVGAICAGCTFAINFSDLEINNVRVGLSYKF